MYFSIFHHWGLRFIVILISSMFFLIGLFLIPAILADKTEKANTLFEKESDFFYKNKNDTTFRENELKTSLEKKLEKNTTSIIELNNTLSLFGLSNVTIPEGWTVKKTIDNKSDILTAFLYKPSNFFPIISIQAIHNKTTILNLEEQKKFFENDIKNIIGQTPCNLVEKSSVIIKGKTFKNTIKDCTSIIKSNLLTSFFGPDVNVSKILSISDLTQLLKQTYSYITSNMLFELSLIAKDSSEFKNESYIIDSILKSIRFNSTSIQSEINK